MDLPSTGGAPFHRTPCPARPSFGSQRPVLAFLSTKYVARTARPAPSRQFLDRKASGVQKAALAESATDDSAASHPSSSFNITYVTSSVDAVSTSGRGLEARPSSPPFEQLVAAWDSLSARLPPHSGNGADADLLVATLKLVLAGAPPDAAARALALAKTLAEQAGVGIPLNARAIAAGILAEAFPRGYPAGGEALELRLGPEVLSLMADLWKVRRLPSRIELYDDEAAAALRELCLAFYDVRATAVEVVSRLHSLQQISRYNVHAEHQVAALEALQIYAPLGHALGLSGVASRLEDTCFQVLFPASYEATTAWLRQQADANQQALEGCRAALKREVEASPRFQLLASGLEVFGRTKTPFSMLKKLLRLGDTARGGRARSEVHDVIGIRAVVLPRRDLPAAAAEAAAVEACYLVEAAAHAMWTAVEGRSKDYITAPKPNGYQSLHSAVVLERQQQQAEEEGSPSTLASASSSSLSSEDGVATLELQIRTEAMHAQAESGAAAHAAYKGGLNSSQAAQLRDWTNSLLLGGGVASSSASVSAANPTSPAATLVDRASLSSSAVDAEGGRQQWEPHTAAAALFRSLDLDGDGRVSLEELRHAVQELGGSGLDAAAAALLAAADTNADGEVSLEEFLEFQARVGMVHAASAMDEATAADLLGSIDVEESASLGEAGAAGLRPADPSASSSDWEVGPVDNGGMGMFLHSWADGDARRRSGKGKKSLSQGRPSARASFIERNSDSMSGSSLDDALLDSKALEVDPQAVGGPSSHSPSANGRVNGNGALRLSPPQQQEEQSSDEEDEEGYSTASASSPAFSNDASSQQPPPQRPELAAKPDRRHAAKSSKADRAMHGIYRIFNRAGVPDLAAQWQLVPVPTAGLPATDAAGQPLPGGAISLPRHGPCVVGAVRDKDCDVVLDLPTVSGRHARLEVIRQRAVGMSKCVIMDLGSTNGTWVNRARIVPFKEAPLYPGDVVCIAEPPIAFEVRAVEPEEFEDEEWETGHGPAVAAALRAAAALEAEAASRGVFAPQEAPPKVGERARKLLTGGEYQAAYMLLLGGVMAAPQDAGLWAQLAALERQRARRSQQGSSPATARTFLRAAAERFDAEADPAVRRSGLASVFSTWAQLEYDMRNDGPARNLFQKAIRMARSHPAGPIAAGAAKLTFTWASREWRMGDAPLAARLCREALDLEPTNPYALTLLGSIQVSTGDMEGARALFRAAVASDKRYVTALQCWGRLEAGAGNMEAARGLFKRALRLEEGNVFVWQAWAVAEARADNVPGARVLLQRCTQVDPECRAAWHAWGKLEDDAGEVDRARELYSKVLQLKSNNVVTLSALGRLERRAGNLSAARKHLEAALERDPKLASALKEMSHVLREEGQDAEAYRLEKKAAGVNRDRQAMIAQVGSPGRRHIEQAHEKQQQQKQKQ